MISWWLIPTFGAFCIGLALGDTIGGIRCYNNYSKLKISPEDIHLSEAKLETLWLSKTLENICNTPCCPDCCKAERWREEANKWAKKVIKERIKEKAK